MENQEKRKKRQQEPEPEEVDTGDEDDDATSVVGSDDDDEQQDAQEMLTEEELNDIRMAEKRERDQRRYDKAMAKQAMAHRRAEDKTAEKVRNDVTKKHEKTRKNKAKDVNDFTTKKGNWSDLGIERTGDRNFCGMGYFIYLGNKRRGMGKRIKEYENVIVEVNYEKGGENKEYKFSMPPVVFAAVLRAGPNVLANSQFMQECLELSDDEEQDSVAQYDNN